MKNDGDYPITNAEVEIWEPIHAKVLGEKSQTLGTLDANGTGVITFEMEAEYDGNYSMTVYVSYKTCTGYEASKYYNEFSVEIPVSKKISTITCTVSSAKIEKGDEFIISGKLTPAKKEVITLTFRKPDNSTMDRTTLSTIDGEYSYGFTPDLEGSWTVKASWTGDFTYEGAVSSIVSFTVEKKKCIIATATYGSELSPEVQFLRSFRDSEVLSTFAGSQFMVAFNNFYYSFSPGVASVISDNPLLRDIMKAVLYPLIGILHSASITYSAFIFCPELAILLSGLVASSLIGIVYLTIPLIILLKVKRVQKYVSKTVRALKVMLIGGLTLILVSELTYSSVIMMLATGSVVLTTLSLSALYTSKGITRLLDHMRR